MTGICSSCGKVRVIRNKTHQLCQICNNKRLIGAKDTKESSGANQEEFKPIKTPNDTKTPDIVTCECGSDQVARVIAANGGSFYWCVECRQLWSEK